mmetsp:Transcript_6585/g.17888  ORF Transcript_6585/g.17888 Transcript_6585/m.17888 type:complete len:282 (+) Transcript_6585:34-879(+)
MKKFRILHRAVITIDGTADGLFTRSMCSTTFRTLRARTNRRSKGAQSRIALTAQIANSAQPNHVVHKSKLGIVISKFTPLQILFLLLLFFFVAIIVTIIIISIIIIIAQTENGRQFDSFMAHRPTCQYPRGTPQQHIHACPVPAHRTPLVVTHPMCELRRRRSENIRNVLQIHAGIGQLQAYLQRGGVRVDGHGCIRRHRSPRVVGIEAYLPQHGLLNILEWDDVLIHDDFLHVQLDVALQPCRECARRCHETERQQRCEAQRRSYHDCFLRVRCDVRCSL